MAGNGETASPERVHWADRVVSMGQLVVALVVALGGLFLWGLAQESRVTRIEERQAGVLARNAEQDKQLLDQRTEILDRLEVINARLTDLQVTNAIQHGTASLSSTPPYNGKRNRLPVDR